MADSTNNYGGGGGGGGDNRTNGGDSSSPGGAIDQVAGWVSAAVVSAFFSSLERFSCVDVSTVNPGDDSDDDENGAPTPAAAARPPPPGLAAAGDAGGGHSDVAPSDRSGAQKVIVGTAVLLVCLALFWVVSNRLKPFRCIFRVFEEEEKVGDEGRICMAQDKEE